MPRQPYRPRALVGQLFRGSEVLRHELLTASQLRSQAWIHLRYDIYADARLDRDHELSCRATAMGLPPDAVLAGPSAAYLHGVPHAATFTDDVHVILPAKAPALRQNGVRFHATDLRTDEVDGYGATTRTTPLRTAWDLAGWLDPVEAVIIIDGLLGAGLVDPDQLTRLAVARRGRRGSARARRAFALADGRSQSPPESRLRVGVIRAGLPPPVPQFPVPVRGRVLHPDLAWPQYKIAIEYDGQWHDAPDQFHRDRRRLNLLVAEGWIILHVTSRRLHTDLNGIIYETRQALLSRGWCP